MLKTTRQRQSIIVATVRASYMFINRVDVHQATKEMARFMSEPSEGAWNMLKRLIRYLIGHGRLVQVTFEQRHVKAPRVDTDSDLRGMCTHSKQFNRSSSFFTVSIYLNLEVGRKVHDVRVLQSRNSTQESKAHRFYLERKA